MTAVSPETTREAPRLARASGSAPDWRAVATRRVYFGHQSVGNDIVAGLETLNEQQDLGLRFVRTLTPAAVAGPAFVHFPAGVNGDPASKNEALLRELDARPEPDGAIALLKYCYVDVNERTDVPRMFDAYRRMTEEVHRRHPDVCLVHTTVPLTAVESAAKALVKGLLGRVTVRAAAVARHRYNELVRSAFSTTEPLFDVAAAEAIGGDGSRAGFAEDDARVETLSAEYTHDGGHLTAKGRLVVAARLLDVLASVANAGEATP
jgi:hypothetical protein